MTNPNVAYGADTLHPAIRSRFLDNINGLNLHILEAGDPQHPLLLLLHGFPELAYSWRSVIPTLADAGYHVVAPDQRGYGRTTGADADYDADLLPYGMFNLVRDTIGLVAALGRDSAASVIGHDFGSPVAAWSALIRPDIFHSAVMMSGPFVGPPALPAGEYRGSGAAGSPAVADALAALDQPRKHYQSYYCTRPAADDMRNAPQGVHDFLRGYYHMKSADWTPNQPHPLAEWSADELAKLPNYYVMQLDDDMPATVAREMPSAEAIAACQWLPDAELAVYAAEFARNGFQGGLHWYRAAREPRSIAQLQVFAGRKIDVPTCFIGGASDWGVHQSPGAFDRMPQHGCSQMLARHLVKGAGHWVQQEQPQAVARHLLDFLRDAAV